MQDPNKKVRGKRLNQDDVIQDFIRVHGDRYDYSKVIFKTNNDKVTIICKRHGEFDTTPKRHRKGANCRKCFIEDTNGKYHKDEEFRKQLSLRMKNSHDKLKEGMIKKYGVDNPSKSEDICNKRMEYFLKTYGVKNPFELSIEERIKKMIITKIQNGKYLSDENRTPFEIYKRKVWEVTDRYIKIFPELNKRSRNIHLDHIYSIYEGFKNNIDPEIIGHFENLQLLESKLNISKSSSCWISLEELLHKIKNSNIDNHKKS